MQNWKIKKMSYKRINLHLSAIAVLAKHYKEGTDLLFCPLCVEPGCADCLWEIIEGKQCFDFRRELGIEGEMIIIRNYKEWQEARIPMLKRWKKILKAELKRRAELGA